jgi:hypothetical protein
MGNMIWEILHFYHILVHAQSNQWEVQTQIRLINPWSEKVNS